MVSKVPKCTKVDCCHRLEIGKLVENKTEELVKFQSGKELTEECP